MRSFIIFKDKTFVVGKAREDATVTKSCRGRETRSSRRSGASRRQGDQIGTAKDEFRGRSAADSDGSSGEGCNT